MKGSDPKREGGGGREKRDKHRERETFDAERKNAG